MHLSLRGVSECVLLQVKEHKPAPVEEESAVPEADTITAAAAMDAPAGAETGKICIASQLFAPGKLTCPVETRASWCVDQQPTLHGSAFTSY